MHRFVINRRAGIPLRQQLALQIEMMILRGELPVGKKLPSIRSLARRLKLQPNTVAAAYRSLRDYGDLSSARGAGVFTRRGAHPREDRRDSENGLRDAVRAAMRRGLAADAIKKALLAWLHGPAPDRLVVLDPAIETAEILALEMRGAVEAPIVTCRLEEALREPRSLSGSLVVALPFHVELLHRLESQGSFTAWSARLAPPNERSLLALPSGATVLVVSHSPRVLPYASMIVRCLRGDELYVECHLLEDEVAWRHVLPAADLVLADALAGPVARRLRPRRFQEIPLLSEASLQEIAEVARFPRLGLLHVT